MSIYSHFDFSSNEHYLKHLKSFEELNKNIYNKILRGNIPIHTLALYVESLISLDLFVEKAFNDLIRNNKVGIHPLKYLIN